MRERVRRIARAVEGGEPDYDRPEPWELLAVAFLVCTFAGSVLIWLSILSLLGVLSGDQGAASFLAGLLLGFVAWILSKIVDRTIGLA
jgi:hypothetical protein